MSLQLTVIAMTAAEPNLRGLLTRWCLEPVPGLYCGLLSARVRDQLWQEVEDAILAAGAHAALVRHDQGQLSITTAGHRPREPIDLDGTTLIAWALDDPYAPETDDNFITNW